jgi:hypothetical protein
MLISFFYILTIFPTGPQFCAEAKSAPVSRSNHRPMIPSIYQPNLSSTHTKLSDTTRHRLAQARHKFLKYKLHNRISANASQAALPTPCKPNPTTIQYIFPPYMYSPNRSSNPIYWTRPKRNLCRHSLQNAAIIARLIDHFCMARWTFVAAVSYDGGGSKAKAKSYTSLNIGEQTLNLENTLQIAVSWYQHAAGVSWSLFDDVTTPVDYTAQARWLPSLRAFLGTIDGHFDLDETYIPPAQRDGDIYLMDLVTRSDAFTSHEASIINYGRLFLGVVTLSDICTAIGDTLIPGIEWGELDQSTSRSIDHTTHQPAPAIFFGPIGNDYSE